MLHGRYSHQRQHISTKTHHLITLSSTQTCHNISAFKCHFLDKVNLNVNSRIDSNLLAPEIYFSMCILQTILSDWRLYVFKQNCYLQVNATELHWWLLRYPARYITNISGVGVTKAPFINFSVSKIFDLAKLLLRLFESHLYLTGATAAELRRHLSNINMIFNK